MLEREAGGQQSTFNELAVLREDRPANLVGDDVDRLSLTPIEREGVTIERKNCWPAVAGTGNDKERVRLDVGLDGVS
jgi:hypothetical protein